MEKLKLRYLTKEDESAHADFIKEMLDSDGKMIPTAVEFDESDGSFSRWLERTNNEAKGIDVTQNRVPASVLFLFRQGDKKILGAVNIRYKLNDFLLKYSGNIGYGIAPSQRRKGYASIMLSMTLDICRDLKLEKVLISCNKDNIGSARTIQKNGGILENEFTDDKGIVRQRYWIKL